MDKFTIACVQMRQRMHATVDDYRDDLSRFLRAADAKRARLVLFPELAGLTLASLLLRDVRSNLLRRAEQGRKRSAGAWNRLSGAAAGWLAQALKADLGMATAGVVDLEAQRVWELYVEVFGGLARTHGVTIVAPSAYLPDTAAEAGDAPPRRNLSAVFGPSGELLGTQTKVLGANEDDARVARGRTWQVIPTEVGRIGLLLGSDVLYPEVGRLLAYQNAEVLLLQAACPSAAAYHKLRAAILARMQDNQLYAAASFLVGESPLHKGAPPYMGRSAILAPQELTPKYNGLLVEMGSVQSEGVVTAEWDYPALKRLWETSETPLRRALNPTDAAPLIAALYTQLQALPAAPALELLASPPALAAANTDEITVGDAPLAVEGDDADVRDLDDLPLLGSVKSHWPLQDAAPGGVVAEEIVEAIVQQEVEWTSPRSYVEATATTEIRRDDETDEMDAVKNQPAAAEPEPAGAAGPVTEAATESAGAAEAAAEAAPAEAAPATDTPAEQSAEP